MLRGGPGIFAAAPDQPSLSGQRKGRRVADMVRISADMRRAAGGVRGEPVADAPRFFLSIAICPVEQGQPVSGIVRSEEHTSELQSLMRISYAVFCLKKKINTHTTSYHHTTI